MLPFLSGSAGVSIRPGRPTGNKALRRVVADGDRAERRGAARGGNDAAGRRRTKDEGRRGRYRQRRIKTNEHGRVLCSLRRREIGTAVNLRDKSFTNFDHGKSLISGEKSRLGCATVKDKELGKGRGRCELRYTVVETMIAFEERSRRLVIFYTR